MAKKGLPTIAWVAIGCGGLVIVAGLVAVLGMGFLFKKGKDAIQEFEKDPVAAMAKVTAAANPEIELVETDKENQVVTFRNVKTGELVKIDYQDVKEGKISFQNGDEKVEFDGTAAGNGESGSLTVTTNEGTTTYQAGTDTGNVPGWVHLYPGATVAGSSISSGTGGHQGYLALETTDSVDEVAAHYKGWFEDQGYSIGSEQRIDSAGSTMVMMGAKNESNDRTMNVTVISEKGKTNVAVNFSDAG